MQKIFSQCVLTLALLLLSTHLVSAAEIITHDFVIEPTHIALSDRPEIINEVDARTYASAPQNSNYFSGWNLLAATLLLTGFGTLLLYRFVRHEQGLQDRS